MKTSKATVHFTNADGKVIYKVEGIPCQTFGKGDDETFTNAIVDKIVDAAFEQWRIDHAGMGLQEPTSSDWFISYQHENYPLR